MENESPGSGLAALSGSSNPAAVIQQAQPFSDADIAKLTQAIDALSQPEEDDLVKAISALVNGQQSPFSENINISNASQSCFQGHTGEGCGDVLQRFAQLWLLEIGITPALVTATILSNLRGIPVLPPEKTVELLAKSCRNQSTPACVLLSMVMIRAFLYSFIAGII